MKLAGSPEADKRRYDQIEKQRRLNRTVFHEPISDSAQAKRDELERDLRGWITFFFPKAYYLKFSDDHIKVINKLERAVLEHGLFAECMPRGSGKTTIAGHTGIFALVNGHRKFLMLIANDFSAAKNLLDGMLSQLMYNDLLHEHYPEVTTYFRATEGSGRKSQGQLGPDDQKTRIVVSKDQLVFPAVPGSKCSESVVMCAGITGGIRGRQYITKEGEVIRPDLAIVEDPQNKESAESPSQCTKRLEIINGDVLGLPGPGKNISCVIPCTVIREGDLSSKLLDRELAPQFQGERMSFIYKWPDNEDLWKDYSEMYRDELRQEIGHDGSMEFYVSQREEMDRGAIVAWPERFDEKFEVSAIQFAYNKRISIGEDAWDAEYDNNPKSKSDADYELTPEIVGSRTNGISRMIAPSDALVITSFCDINFVGINWMVMAHDPDGTGYIIDYGKYPEGRKRLIQKRSGLTETQQEAIIYEALVDVHSMLSGNTYLRDGVRAGVDLSMVDAGRWQHLVLRFTKAARFKGLSVVASAGRSNKKYRVPKKPIASGDGWHYMQWDSGKVKGRIIIHNADKYRVKFQKAFLQSPGAPGSLSLYGDDSRKHKRLANECSAEKLMEHMKSENGEQDDAYTWHHPPGSDWDLGDCTAGNLVAGARCGVGPRVIRPRPKGGRRRGKISKVQI